MTEPAAGRSDLGRVRENNEDRWLARRYGGTVLLAVADGVGGTSGGEIASGASVESLATAFAVPRPRQSPRTTLADAIQLANEAVLRESAERGHPQAASTLVAAAIRGHEAIVANIGDSRAYLVRGGSARQITTDHSAEPAGAITRYLGDSRGVQPDIFVQTVRSGDRLVLCSDGLTRHLSDAEIGAQASAGDPGRAAEALIGMANARGGEDNVTVVIYPVGRSRSAGGVVGTAILIGLLLLGVAALLTTTAGTIPAGPPSVGPVPTGVPTAP